YGTFGETVALVASGHPAGSTAGFSVDPVTPPGASLLTVSTAGVAAGSSTITVTGTSNPSAIVDSASVGLTVYTAAPGAPTLTSPANGATGIGSKPTFVWAAVADATGYLLELDNDASFTTPFYSAGVAGTSHTLTTPLPRSQQVYWRVTPENPCGDGAATAPFSFTVDDALCWQPSLAIPDDPDVSDTRSIVGLSGVLTDLDLVLRATHTYVGDMIFRLVHVDTATTVTLIDRPGSCGNNDFDVLLNDEGTDGTVESACNASPPAVSGNRTPNNPLSAFDTQSISGSWRLECSDQAGQDTGTLQEWCLVPTGVVDGGLFSDDFEFGSSGRWSAIVD
ncbi:MAG: proprotein convertase P-domain-containing protein, partial [Thermoanaerobaculia bacterium]|nr:proprotein convertase P-domain-containing protein [Thermoanaerobaculia bacterium]